MNGSDTRPAWLSFSGWSGGGARTHPSPPRSPRWSYVETFGIVHQEDCHTCRQYMDHISNAIKSDTSYALAAKERDEDLTKRFLEGFRKGRETQREHDSERLRTYHTQRNEARATNLVYEADVRQANNEISRLRDELVALRLAYDELSLIHRTPDSGWSSEGAALLPPEDLGFDYVRDAGSSSDDGVESMAEESSIGSESGSGDESVEGRTEDLMSQPDNLGRCLDQLPLDSDGDHIGTFVDNGDHPPDDINLEQHIVIGGRPPTPPILPPEFYTLEEVKELMFFAHQPGSDNVRAYVRLLVSEAHNTHPELRTEIQRLLLKDWRRPAATPEPDSGPLEIYVDASEIGIGFIFQDKWQSWGLRDGWKTRLREIQWAEAAAAELGLRLMIEAGYTGRKILLRSDNSGVVQAIQTRSFCQSQIGAIVRHIHDLCVHHQITLEVKWVRGLDNPADDPSRMRSHDQNQRFPHVVDIPPHLQDFVFQIDSTCE